MNDDLAEFEVTTDGVRGTVVINGEDVTKLVGRVVFEAGSGQPSRLGIELAGAPEGTISGKGIVEVMPNVSQQDLVLAWLNAIDPEALSKAALSKGSGLGGPNPIEAALEVLKEWASGTPN